MAKVPLRLLLVDDDDVDRLAIIRSLRSAHLGAEIDELAGAAGIEERLRDRSYDCLILDHFLPDDTGLGVIQRLRGAGIMTPILVVTGHDDDIGATLVAAGASDYLPKDDMTPARLASRLRYAIRLGEVEAEALLVRRQLAEERRLLASVLAQLPSAVVVAQQGSEQLLLVNQMLGALLPGADASADLGALLGSIDAHHVDGRPYDADEWPIVRALRAGEVIGGEEMTISGSRGDRILRTAAAPIHDDAQRAFAAVMTLDDVTEEVQAKEAALRAARQREELVAAVSHDLRGPLNSVSVASDCLADPTLPPESRERYLAAVRRSVTRADRMISDLLDASRIEAGKLTIEPRPLTVAPILAQAARDHELLATEAGMKIEVETAAGLERVLADRDRLLQALANLINNAIRHARGTGTIRLEADGAGEQIRIRVIDRGPGIPADFLPHIFDRYWQGGRQRRSTGLGLAIAKGIVDAHGGSIAATSTAGQGACFTITLARAA